MTLTLEALRVGIGDFYLRDIGLVVNDGEYFVLLGPTGSGKTVLLETVAGLHRVDAGKILLGGQDITSLPPERRGTSIVYQDYALFPHLSVQENVAFGLKCGRKTKHDISEAFDWAVATFDIRHLLHRKPATLSGGERQKVALARALAPRPAVLLLDEPLSALDPETREVLQEELRRLHALLKATIIHVTHSFEEAIALGNRVAVLGRGRLHQVGTPGEIFNRPESEFVARFTGAKNILHGTVSRLDGRSLFSTVGIEFSVTTDHEGAACAVVRPEAIALSLVPVLRAGINCLPGKIVDLIDRGSSWSLTLEMPAGLTCLVSRASAEELQPRAGQEVYACFKTSSVHVLPEEKR